MILNGKTTKEALTARENDIIITCKLKQKLKCTGNVVWILIYKLNVIKLEKWIEFYYHNQKYSPPLKKPDDIEKEESVIEFQTIFWIFLQTYVVNEKL